jgi:histidyl-tRNA synthetase
MEYANKINAPIAVIVGPKEAAEGTVKIREMQSGKESELDTSELVKIKSLLGKS